MALHMDLGEEATTIIRTMDMCGIKTRETTKKESIRATRTISMKTRAMEMELSMKR